MTNYVIGHDAEKQAAEYLKQQGFKILELNWKTKYCEIDIVAQKKKIIYFVEVKYRKSDFHGTGLDYITPKKLNQMRFAAEFWVSANNWNGDYRLAAIAVDNDEVTFLEEI